MASVMNFGDMLAARIEGAGLTRIAFAKEVESSSGFMTDVIKGRRTPPLDRLDRWIEVLGLSPKEADQFRFLAGVAHIPEPSIRAIVTAIYEEHQEVMDWVALLKKKIAAMPPDVRAHLTVPRKS